MNFRQQYQSNQRQPQQQQQYPTHQPFQQQQPQQYQQQQQYPQQYQQHPQQYQPQQHRQPQQQPLRPQQSGPASYNSSQNYVQEHPGTRSQSVYTLPSQQQQPLQPQQSGKGGLWSRLRSQLTVSSGDHDGDTEDETVLATALVKFYAENQGGVPSWLSTAKAAKAYHGGGNGSSQQNFHAAGAPQNSGMIRPGGSSLQDIYKRTNSVSSGPSHASQTYAAQPPIQDYSQGTNNGGSNWRAGGNGGGAPAPDKNDRFRNKLRSAGRPSLESSSSYNSTTNSSGTSGTASWRSKATW